MVRIFNRLFYGRSYSGEQTDLSNPFAVASANDIMHRQTHGSEQPGYYMEFVRRSQSDGVTEKAG